MVSSSGGWLFHKGGGWMRRHTSWVILFAICISLYLSACARNYTVPYTPRSVPEEPAKIIERVLRQQPPAYSYVPFDINVGRDCIQFKTVEWTGMGANRRPNDLVTTLCYNNIGRITLNRGDCWYVDVYERGGAWMYQVWSYNEKEAKLFIDALYAIVNGRAKIN
jgi:hypothetical protein